MLRLFRSVVSAFRCATLLAKAEDLLAYGDAEGCWLLIEQVEALRGERWPARQVDGYVNLQVAVAALNVGRHALADQCARAAEQQFCSPKALRPADARYLGYYAVMISRSARRASGEKLPDRSLYYPPLSDSDVAAVHRRWRRKFPLVEVDRDAVP